ncbi:MAG: serine hydrolase [Rhodobacteraceae bacterium]|nr:serine hydrolase [Paracoccaceae bacterium]MBR9821760.1 serine hydrolase [Paracoccaceae bacterium]
MITRRALLGSALALPFIRPASAAVSDRLVEAGERLDQLHALIVHRNGEEVFSRAFRGPGLDRLANIKSCSKSLVALMLGVAIAEGAVPGVDSTLAEVAPGLIPATATEGAGDITLGDLASLRGGLAATSGADYGAWVSSGNWIRYALTREMVAAPGTRMIYSTGATHVLGAALAEATGDSLLTLMRTHLGRPLGIDVPPWTRDPQGYYMGGNEMALTPRAMLRVAEMMRNGGRHEGAQVIPGDWVARSTEPLTRSPWSGMSYGYGWFMTDSGYTLARGYGGQMIAWHAERGLSVALTSDPLRPALSDGYFGDLVDLLDGPLLEV